MPSAAAHSSRCSDGMRPSRPRSPPAAPPRLGLGLGLPGWWLLEMGLGLGLRPASAGAQGDWPRTVMEPEVRQTGQTVPRACGASQKSQEDPGRVRKSQAGRVKKRRGKEEEEKVANYQSRRQLRP